MTRRFWAASVAIACVLTSAGCGASHTAKGSGSATSGTAAGNGEASKPPGTVLADAAAALRSVRSYVMQGQITQSGHVERVKAVTSSGSLDVVMSGAGGHLEARILPGGAYVEVDQAFLRAQGASVGGGLLANRWLQIPATSAQALASQFAQFTPATAARCLVEDHGTLSLAGRTTVMGRPAVLVKDVGNVPGDGPGTLAVATTGTPYPLEAIGTGPKHPGGRIDVCNDGKPDNSRGRLTFSQFGHAPPITAPSNPLRIGPQSGVI